MKKLIGVLMIGAAVIFAAGTANATFANGNLEMVVVDSNGNEYGQNLGALSSITSGNLGTALSLIPAGDVNLGDASVYFFSQSTAVVSGTTRPVLDIWTTSVLTQTEVNSWAQMNTTTSTTPSAITSYFAFANGLATTNGWYSTGAATTGDFNSGLGGTYTQFLNVLTGVTLSTSMDTQLTEYQFTGGSASTGRTITTGPLGLTISDVNDVNSFQASVTQSVSPTPIPPSFLLFGSGLLGLIGLKRRCS